MSGQYVLYRYFDDGDCLLYVGKSRDLAERERSHIRRSQWMQFTARSAIQRYDTPEEMSDAERHAIETEHPIFNRNYNDTPAAASRLRAYLEDAGRPGLIPARIKALMLGQDPPPGVAEDVLDVLRAILADDSTDHATIRLRALAALEGFPDLPGGIYLARLAKLASVSLSTAYNAKRRPVQRGRNTEEVRFL